MLGVGAAGGDGAQRQRLNKRNYLAQQRPLVGDMPRDPLGVRFRPTVLTLRSGRTQMTPYAPRLDMRQPPPRVVVPFAEIAIPRPPPRQMGFRIVGVA